MSARVDVFNDPDLVTLLADEPELLAVADAIAITTPVRVRKAAWSLLLAAALALAVGLAAVTVWDGGGRASLVDRALAAVGEGPVVHAIIRTSTENAHWSENVYVDLETGERTPQQGQTEIWFDKAQAREHTVTRVEGRVVSDLLVTPELLASPDPPVYTCAWITAHPEAAKRVGVGCDPKDANLGYTPQLDPALATFIDGYRAALERGTAKEVGKGEIDGRSVTWLSLALPRGGTEQVAVDDETGRPVRVRRAARAYDVLLLETLGRSEGDFRAPKVKVEPASGRVGAAGFIPVAEAPEAVPGALWAGPAVSGLRLSEVELQHPTTSFGPDSDRPPVRGVGVELRYGERGQIRIQQSRAPQMAYAWYSDALVPRTGSVLLGFSGGWLRRDGVYIRIWSQDPVVVVEVARALRPIES
jgi:hypothetical protein